MTSTITALSSPFVQGYVVGALTILFLLLTFAIVSLINERRERKKRLRNK